MASQKLQEGDQIPGSLSGLAEVKATQYAETVKEYLNHNKLKIIKTAFLALQKLDEESAYIFALANLGSSFSGLRNLNIDFLSAVPAPEVLRKAREIYENGDYELKKSMLYFFHKTGGWAIIPDLMMGTTDENEYAAIRLYFNLLFSRILHCPDNIHAQNKPAETQ